MAQPAKDQPGWFTDRSDKMGRERYWDGERWTRRRRWPENPTFEQRALRDNGGRLPDWYAGRTYVAIIVGLALLLSVAGPWWGGLALLGWFAGMYFVMKYVPWLPSSGGDS